MPKNESKNKPGVLDDFAPTHGRSPEQIQEMMESIRANDQVHHPDDTVAGRKENIKGPGMRAGKDGGQPGNARGAKQSTKQASQKESGKGAALDRSKAGTAKGSSAGKGKAAQAPAAKSKKAQSR